MLQVIGFSLAHLGHTKTAIEGILKVVKDATSDDGTGDPVSTDDFDPENPPEPDPDTLPMMGKAGILLRGLGPRP